MRVLCLALAMLYAVAFTPRSSPRVRSYRGRPLAVSTTSTSTDPPTTEQSERLRQQLMASGSRAPGNAVAKSDAQAAYETQEADGKEDVNIMSVARVVTEPPPQVAPASTPAPPEPPATAPPSAVDTPWAALHAEYAESRLGASPTDAAAMAGLDAASALLCHYEMIVAEAMEVEARTRIEWVMAVEKMGKATAREELETVLRDAVAKQLEIGSDDWYPPPPAVTGPSTKYMHVHIHLHLHPPLVTFEPRPPSATFSVGALSTGIRGALPTSRRGGRHLSQSQSRRRPCNESSPCPTCRPAP